VLALAFFGKLQHLVVGSVLGAFGVVVMHYLGMAAMYVSMLISLSRDLSFHTVHLALMLSNGKQAVSHGLLTLNLCLQKHTSVLCI
jgi:NO-binding membrane sensor protein with MHYT domain